MRAVDVAVIGSGIIGLGVAHAAARRGSSVVVLDRAPGISGASVRNFGHLCIGAQSGEAARYADLARGIWIGLAHDAGFDLRTSGTLVAARHEDELAVLEAARDDDRHGPESGWPDGGVRMLTADQVRRRAPVATPELLGGAFLGTDLQTDPRAAAASIARMLASRGVEFRYRTAVTRIVGASESGEPTLVDTTRGPVLAANTFVAVNHDLDQLLPGLAEETRIARCSLDMLRVDAGLSAPLSAPLLTGWSLARYGRFADQPQAEVMRRRLHGERPDLAAIDLNQMYTQAGDASLIVGDTHTVATEASPFRPESAQELLLQETQRLFGVPRPRVIERWQGVYAKGEREFLRRQVAPGVVALAATTGIGMTCGLGLAEEAVRETVDNRHTVNRHSDEEMSS